MVLLTSKLNTKSTSMGGEESAGVTNCSYDRPVVSRHGRSRVVADIGGITRMKGADVGARVESDKLGPKAGQTDRNSTISDRHQNTSDIHGTAISERGITFHDTSRTAINRGHISR